MSENNSKNPIKKIARFLRKQLFGAQEKEAGSLSSQRVNQRETANLSEPKTNISVVRNHPTIKPGYKKDKRPPYFIQIGFDFGTAFSKCIIRDIGTDSARIFIPEKSLVDDLPFLLPSLLHIDGRKLSLAARGTDYYSDDNLSFIKMALTDIAQGTEISDYLHPYLQIANKYGYQLEEFVKICAIFYLAQYFGLIVHDVKKKHEDFGCIPNDSIYINVPIPVGDVSNHEIRSTFNKIVSAAWCIKDNFTSLRSFDVKEIKLLLKHNSKSVDIGNPPWFIYPEISANVQSYVRSSTSNPGIYLFVDTGAGTVDQAVFMFSRTNGEKLTYLSAEVSSLGSSFIERYAMEFQDENEGYSLNDLKRAKERGTQLNCLNQARYSIKGEIKKQSLKVLSQARGKLTDRTQLKDVELIFGGGGHCKNPYKLGVKDAFTDNLFDCDLYPTSIGLPEPSYLEGLFQGVDHGNWFKRLSVAYGLSFPKYELVKFYLPSEIPEAVPVEQAPPREYNDLTNWQGHGMHG